MAAVPAPPRPEHLCPFAPGLGWAEDASCQEGGQTCFRHCPAGQGEVSCTPDPVLDRRPWQPQFPQEHREACRARAVTQWGTGLKGALSLRAQPPPCSRQPSPPGSPAHSSALLSSGAPRSLPCCVLGAWLAVPALGAQVCKVAFPKDLRGQRHFHCVWLWVKLSNTRPITNAVIALNVGFMVYLSAAPNPQNPHT